MYFGDTTNKEYRITFSLARNGVCSGSHSSKYFAKNMSEALTLSISEFNLFRNEKVQKIVVTKE
jgi:hypothetical protein